MIGVCYVCLTILFLFVTVAIAVCSIRHDETCLGEDDADIYSRMLDGDES